MKEQTIVSASQLAEILQLSTERIRQLGHDGVLSSAGRGRYYFVKSFQGYARKLRISAYGEQAVARQDELVADFWGAHDHAEKLEAEVAAHKAKATP